MLVEPATVDRWHREGLRRCWRRSRRSGRPCIDTACRDLIRRMASENCLWGAPRIHGELLKLGISISERTVSRYLRDRPTTRSQTWRIFVANHFGDRTFRSPVMFSDARGHDVAVDASDRSSRQTPLAIDGSAPPFLGRVSIGVVRSNTRLVACVSPSSSERHRRTKERRPGPAAASPVTTGLTTSDHVDAEQHRPASGVGQHREHAVPSLVDRGCRAWQARIHRGHDIRRDHQLGLRTAQRQVWTTNLGELDLVDVQLSPTRAGGVFTTLAGDANMRVMNHVARQHDGVWTIRSIRRPGGNGDPDWSAASHSDFVNDRSKGNR